MSLDTMLVVGLILIIFCIPALLAAWSESRPLYFRAGALLVALGMVAWPVIRSPEAFAPANWIEISLTVVARIIP